jgi:Restriction endonuclease
MTRRPRKNETFWQLLEWSSRSEDAERLATQVLEHRGYYVRPSQPRGGSDGQADGIVQKLRPNGEVEATRGVMAVYFPSGKVSWATIRSKLVKDAAGVSANRASYLVFVTNQQITVKQREKAAAALDIPLELFHVEDLVTVLDKPSMAQLRQDYLGISSLPNDDPEPLPEPPPRPARPASHFAVTVDLNDETLSAGELLARDHRRLAIVGEAGVGKSHLLTELAATAPPAIVVVFVTLAEWPLDEVTAFEPDWSIEQRLELLLKCNTYAIARKDFERYAKTESTLMVVDGVNELLDPDLMTDITALLEGLSARYPKLSIVLASRADTGGAGRPRSPRRFGKRWQVGFVRRLPVGRVRQAIDHRYGGGTWRGLSERAQAVLEIPFFLRRALDGTDPTAGSRSAALRAFFEYQIDLSDTVLEQVGRELFSSYGGGLRQVSLSDVDETTTVTLAEAGVWERLGDAHALFTHQLYGDYLVSRCLADDVDLWTNPSFDTVTFDVQARDPVLLAAEQLAPTRRIDAFIRAVYNWHWASAVECLLAAEAIEHHRVSEAMHTMVLALLSERRADSIGGTGDRAEGLLAQFTDPLAAKLMKLPAEATPAYVSSITEDDRRYMRWHRVFCRSPGTPWSKSDITGIAATDALHGWTVSNVLRRSKFGEVVAGPLRDLYRSETNSAIIRWRIVHALGRSVSRPTFELLVDALANDEFWVRFGAVRSIVEIAAQTDDLVLRDDAFAHLERLLLDQPDTIADMAVWAAMYKGARPGFHELALALFTHIQDLQTTAAARDRWRDRISDLARFPDDPGDAFRGAKTYGRDE